MKDLGLQDVPVDLIDASDRLRAVDEGYVGLLAENIAETERLRQPLEVRKVGDRFRLIAGGHRLGAVQRLGWISVPCFVYEATADEARLAEIDENIVRHDLNPLDRAIFFAERKKVYERLYPEARHGGDRKSSGHDGHLIGFHRDTAEKSGISQRTIRRAVFIAQSLSEEVRGRIKGTSIAKRQSELEALCKLPPEEQAAVVDMLLAEEPQATSVSDAARRMKGGRTAPKSDVDEQFEALMAKWNRTSNAARRQFLLQIKDSGELDGLLNTNPKLEAVG